MLRDPHVGAFGVIAIALQLIAKVILLHEIAGPPALAALVLIPAWARWGATVWSAAVPPLATGSRRALCRGTSTSGVSQSKARSRAPQRLAGAGAAGALVIVPAIAAYWKYRLGGVTGDCLGAGIEVTETMLLLLIAVRMA